MMRALVTAFAVTVAACAYPQSRVDQSAAPSAIYFAGMPSGSELFVDGISRGDASAYDGRKQVLQTTPGKHLIEVRQNGQVILKREIFVAQGARLKVD
jgi:hypothetical protein